MPTIKYLLVALLFLFILQSCSTTKIMQENILPYPDTSIKPPNTLFLNDTLLVDRTEIRNIDWLEFMYYMWRIEESKSEDLFSITPDTTSLIKVDLKKLKSNQLEYINYKRAYDNLPVVGINLNQAKKFAKWRSNAVFHMYLVKSGISAIESSKRSDILLSLDQYLKSEEASKNKDQVVYYPQYYIPDQNDWILVKESVLSENIEINEIVSADNFNSIRESKKDQKDGENVLYNILGNVSELVDLEGKTFGGSYLDSEADILNMTFKDEKIPNDNVGFRCFCKWVKIEYD